MSGEHGILNHRVRSYAQLMASVRAERPSPQARQRTLAALGLTAAAAGSLAPIAAKKSVVALWLKLIGGSAVAVVVGLMAWQALTARASRPAVSALGTAFASAMAASPADAPVPAAAAGSQHTGDDPVLLDSLPRVVSTQRDGTTPVPQAPPVSSKPSAGALAGETSPASSGPAPTDALAAEVRALDEARSALRAGAAARALALIDRYEREFGAPVLGSEAQVLKIEALMRAGRHHEARTIASEYVRHWPNSPYAPKVRALVGMD